MIKRQIIKIDEALCNGCGLCVAGCHEGALQLIDGKAQMISDLYCDGLGACIGDCPVGAISIEEREAEPYNELAVIQRIAPKGRAVIVAHLKHLKEHAELGYVKEGLDYLSQTMPVAEVESIKSELHASEKKLACGCPGSLERSFRPQAPIPSKLSMAPVAERPSSQLTHWPVQLHLLNPEAAHYRGADLLLAADCTAYAYADFHQHLLRNRSLCIACPKLDHNQEVYAEKLRRMIDSAQINTLTVAIMEVPCCRGLLALARKAAEEASRKVPIKQIVIGVEGEIKEEKWI